MANLKIFPEKSEPNLTARIKLEKSKLSGDPLYEAILLRTTNRKPYKLSRISEEEREALFKSAKEQEDNITKAVFIENSDDIKKLGKASSVNEIAMFENEVLHKLLFEEIVWTREEEKERRKGLYFKTMELKPPAFILKMLSWWPFMNILNSFGVARAIAKDTMKMYSAAPMVCAILTGNGDEDFINAGRLMEHIWLQATLLGLSVHLMTGVIFLSQRLASGEIKSFSKNHVKLIQQAYQTIESIVRADGKNIALLFRIGKSENPTATSIKMSPNIIFQ